MHLIVYPIFLSLYTNAEIRTKNNIAKMYSIERVYNSIVYKRSDETLCRPTLPGVVNCRWSRAGRPEALPGEGCRGVTVSCNWAKDEKAHDRPYSFSYRGQFFSLSGFLYSRVGTQAPSYINTSNTEFSSYSIGDNEYSIGDETELPTYSIGSDTKLLTPYLFISNCV